MNSFSSEMLILVVIPSLFGIVLIQERTSSHREVPLVADDLAADNTNVYAFRFTKAGYDTEKYS